ncbi:MAG: FAD-dependent monooxygenase, partial [Gammaproteobacteria bacterium]|nr:FAD-dependent monooxygenase [Gammaproteobacteria bacterium]
TFGDKLGQMESTGPRGAFPLGLQHARDYVRERIALIGNAAHTIHPLAGQGLNLGVSDAAALAEVLLDARAEGKELGSLRVLRRYERWRKGDNVGVMAAMDGFKRLFGSRGAPLRWLRNTGLKLTNASGPVKDMIMRRALGIEGDLPRLARPQRTASEQALSK